MTESIAPNIPTGICFGPDGNAWFTSDAADPKRYPMLEPSPEIKGHCVQSWSAHAAESPDDPDEIATTIWCRTCGAPMHRGPDLIWRFDPDP